jgi:transposase
MQRQSTLILIDARISARLSRYTVALGRKNALFAGSDGGARHWAMAMTLITTAKLNDVEPMAYLTDVLERVVSGRTRSHELHTLLPWNWQPDSALDMRVMMQAMAA